MRKNIDKLLVSLEDKFNYFESRNEHVSNGSVGWHIEHSLLVIIKIYESISNSDYNKYEWKFRLRWLIFYLSGSFPRGKAKAPPAVLPSEAINLESLKTSVELARKSIIGLKSCHANQFFVHPIFGKLNKKSTMVFFAIHTNHHLKIINDILA
jgi:hypothetical protein